MNHNELISNKEMDSFQAGDNSIIVTGALVRLDPHRVRVGAAPSRVEILRGILSNLQGREIRLLIWDKRVAEFENRIFRQVLRINRPKVVVANPQYFDPGQNLMPLELSVQTSTFIDIVGPMVEEIPVMPDIPSYELSAIGNIPIDIQDIASGFVNQLKNVPDNHQGVNQRSIILVVHYNCDDFERRYNARFDREFPPFPSRSPGDRAGPSRPRILRRTNRLKRQVKKQLDMSDHESSDPEEQAKSIVIYDSDSEKEEDGGISNTKKARQDSSGSSDESNE
ncbi:hypothetical protein HCN44_010853 [Aphidius gifuensis]|uniref:Uncharacterized protein n=1 Tax=Aphidius gifuensis TaxID=684658 RepID=A0A835CLD3_APHGI|nr:hypothetical protein HCN44_010853 [Aphidius gifuensis]